MCMTVWGSRRLLMHLVSLCCAISMKLPKWALGITEYGSYCDSFYSKLSNYPKSNYQQTMSCQLLLCLKTVLNLVMGCHTLKAWLSGSQEWMSIHDDRIAIVILRVLCYLYWLWRTTKNLHPMVWWYSFHVHLICPCIQVWKADTRELMA